MSDAALTRIPPPPANLPEAAFDAWRGWSLELMESNDLKRQDLPAFEVLCRTWADWKRLDDTLQEKGTTYEIATEQGIQVRERPEVRQRDRQFQNLLALLKQFHLTPASR